MTTPTYTAAQYLDAARRAETDGKRDYAVQVYRYLSEQYPGTPEGFAARDGLFRLGELTRPRETTGPATTGRNGVSSSTPAAQSQPQPTAGSLRAALAGQQAQPAQGGIGYAPPATADAGRNGVAASRPAAVETPHAHTYGHATSAEPLPEPDDHYAKSRLAAAIIGIIGWIMLLIGLAMVVAIAVTAFTAVKVPFLLVPGFGILSPTLLIGGGTLVLLSQIARAVFDSANATRHLAAIERAKAGG